MTIIQTMRYWLQVVGAEHNIQANEVHHIYRPDNLLNVDIDYIVFTFDNSSDEQNVDYDNSVDGGSNDADVQLIRSYLRTVTVDCYSENGMDTLESLLASRNHPEIKEILKLGLNVENQGTETVAGSNIWSDLDGRFVVVSSTGIDNKTVWNETRINHQYTLTMTIRKHQDFEKTRTDHIWDNYNATGVIFTPGDPDDLPVTITDQ